MKKILIIGATSAIAEQCARLWAKRGASLFLVARNSGQLETIAADLGVRGARKVDCLVMDANDHDAHEAMFDAAHLALDGVDSVLIAHGTLSDQAQCELSVAETLSELQTNGLSVVALLTLLANRFVAQGGGAIGVISSVAGDRGRASNYVYGSAKAMVTAFTSGMRQRLSKSNVMITTIKPGFVDTPMTAAFDKGLLWAKPDVAAARIVAAMDKRKAVVYVPAFWWWIMTIIKAIPEAIFYRRQL